VSKAFTREDDAGLTPVASERAVSHGPLTAMGRAALRAKLAAVKAGGDRADATAEAASVEARLLGGLVPPPEDRAIAALGAEVTLRDAAARERIVRLVTADEVGLVERGASPISPIGAAVVGAREGDEVELPGGVELTVARVAWPTD
jgi:transcription elongation GreA/GreB family factor